jgi:hypothetical protein
MAPAYRTPPRGIKLPNGGKMQFGQLIGGTPMLQPRKLNTAYADQIGRDGRVPKRIVDAPIKPGMTRQTSGDLHPYLHGHALDDSAPSKQWQDKGSEPITHGMGGSKTQSERGTDKGRAHGSTILQEASRLGRAPEKA